LGDEGGIEYYAIVLLQSFICPSERLIIDHGPFAHVRGDLLIKYILAFQYFQSNQVGPQDRVAPLILEISSLVSVFQVPGKPQVISRVSVPISLSTNLANGSLNLRLLYSSK
jgi:hypothetical protein